jgi:hypothetical protein
MTEHVEQKLLFEWARMYEGRYPELELLFAVPNGGYRAMTTAVKLKQEGVKAGVPDVWLPVPRGDYCGLIIEMKFGRNTTEVSQKEWLTSLSFLGWSCHVCYCFEAARMVVLWYLAQGKGKVHGNKIYTWKTEDDFTLEPRPEPAYRT